MHKLFHLPGYTYAALVSCFARSVTVKDRPEDCWLIRGRLGSDSVKFYSGDIPLACRPQANIDGDDLTVELPPAFWLRLVVVFVVVVEKLRT